jgi:hypothetical protein
VEAIAFELDVASAKQMHKIFEASAEHTSAPETTRRESLRLIIGRLWTHVLDTMARPDGALHLLSGHDWSVSPLLMCIVTHDDALLQHWPPFCSNLAFELWSTREADCREPRRLSHPACAGDASAHEDGRHVRVLYNGQPVQLLCSAPGRQTCTLAEFKRLVAPHAVSDFTREGREDAAERLAVQDSGFTK